METVKKINNVFCFEEAADNGNGVHRRAVETQDIIKILLAKGIITEADIMK